MDYVVVGTAGHVDHGKTELVKALTGVDTDRLKEEKERGISIELGFAPLRLPDGRQLGLVDVPGHERFIRQMLAGVAGIDLVLLVVAADEGVMPQTREHLAIIDLLRVPRGILVVTKIDLVEEEWLALVEEEVREAVKGTALEGAPLVKVSAVTGRGIEELRELLARETSRIPPRPASGRVRLPIDRVFSLSGFGTIVTGTLWSGTVHIGSEVEIQPEGIRSRARSLQVHGRPVGQARAGQRVAVNLTGVDVEEIHRGSVLVEPGWWRPARRLDVSLKLLPEALPLKHRQRVRFYLGTTEALGRVALLDRDDLDPGQQAFAQLILEKPVVAAARDRFILRTYSPLETIGGGEVISVNPPRRRRFREEVIQTLQRRMAGTSRDILLSVVGEERDGLSLRKAALRAEIEPKEAHEILSSAEEEGKVVLLPAGEGDLYIVTPASLNRWWEKIREALEAFHRRYPLRAGLPKEELRTRFFPRLDGRTFDGLLEHWKGEGRISVEGNSVHLAGYRPRLDGRQEKALAVLKDRYRQGHFQPPSPEEAAKGLDLAGGELEEVLHYLVRQGVLVKVAEGLYFHREALAEAREAIRRLGEKGAFTLAEVRDLLGSSRKYVLPLLEYLDHIKFTRRVGDKRIVIG
ncbi:MAG TPA: selenocysteine-specific translation elongation factor [Peptococcaceae bacterium]|nr:selenocysteine-specific translation elongation factor [Peptococcaceae bacterium]